MRAMLLALLALMASAESQADDIPTSPNSVPLFYGFLGNQDRYKDAAFKAQEAFFLQTGVTQQFNLLNGYIASKVTHGVSTFIDEVTPLNSKDVFTIGGAVYALFVRREVTKSFNDPLFPMVSHTVSLSPTTQSLSLRIPF